MRVVHRDTFLMLPAGTIYCKGTRWIFGGLNVKHENFGQNGWYAADPAWVDGADSGECFDRLEEMLAKGTSYPMQDSICRDGPSDAEAVFLIFERADLLILRRWIDTALTQSTT